MSDIQTNEFTRLLERHRNGESSAREQILGSIYSELRKLAARYMSNERSGHTLQPTALVNEAWMRFGASETGAQNKAHFLALAAGVMKEVLIDHARKHRALKRGGDKSIVALESDVAAPGRGSADLLELCDSLEKLKELDERQARLVELRVFGGLSLEETAEALNVSLATAKRDWILARAWLHRELT
jgi:RNA polymerase sigma factor (TIGR02999 family)